MAQEICNNCGEGMEPVGQDTHYCQKCDKTFVIREGKQFVAKKTNAIEQIKEMLKNHGERIDKVEKAQEADDTLCGF